MSPVQGATKDTPAMKKHRFKNGIEIKDLSRQNNTSNHIRFAAVFRVGKNGLNARHAPQKR